MKINKLICFGLLLVYNIGLNSMDIDYSAYPDCLEMLPVVKTWYDSVLKTPKESYSKYEFSGDAADKLSDWMKVNPDFRDLTTQPTSYKNKLLIGAESSLSYLKLWSKNLGRISNLNGMGRGNYILHLPVCEDYVVIISSKWSRTLNHLENLGLYCRQNNLTLQNIADVNTDMQNSQTNQHLSRIFGYQIVKRIQDYKKCYHIKTPETFILKYPWCKDASEICDATACIVQKYIPGLKSVDEQFIRELDKDRVRELYEMAKCAGVWDIGNNIYYDKKTGDVYLFDLEKPNKTKTHVFTLFDMPDPLLVIRTGVESLSKLFPKDSAQFGYLIELINEDEDLYNDYKLGNAKSFRETLFKIIGAKK